jgi:hypothetical protein
MVSTGMLRSSNIVHFYHALKEQQVTVFNILIFKIWIRNEDSELNGSNHFQSLFGRYLRYFVYAFFTVSVIPKHSNCATF